MKNIGNQIKNQPLEGIQVRKIVKNQDLEILSITLERGSSLKEHITHRDATLIVLEGELDFHIQQEVYPLKQHEDFFIPKNLPHWVDAKEDSRLLIIR